MDAPSGPQGKPPVQPRERVWFAHAIRGPACLLVVFTHLFDLFPNAQTLVAQIANFPPLTGLPVVPWMGILGVLARNHISTGALGVLLFFLVSGFVIPFSLEHRNLRGFFVRRFFRLYPTLWVCLLITIAMLAVQIHFLGGALPFGKRTVGANAFLVSSYVRAPWIEPVFWSLAVEELFYVIAATAAWRGLLASRVLVLACAVGLTLFSMAAKTAGPGTLWSALGAYATYVIFILIGVVFHYLYRRRWARTESVALVAAIFGLWVFAMDHQGLGALSTVYIVTSTVALAVFAGLYLVRARLPYSAWLDRLSNISYPLYLLHGVNGYIVIRAAYTVTGNYYVSLAAAVAASVVLATGVHFAVEMPTNSFGRRLSRRLRTRTTPQDTAPPAEVVHLVDPAATGAGATSG